MGRAAGAREVNVGWTNRSKCNEQWEAKGTLFLQTRTQPTETGLAG